MIVSPPDPEMAPANWQSALVNPYCPIPLWPVLPKMNRWALPRSTGADIRAPQKLLRLWFGPKYMSGFVALLVAEVSRSVPGPFTPSIVPVEFTIRLSVPADSAKAPAAAFNGLLDDQFSVPN